MKEYRTSAERVVGAAMCAAALELSLEPMRTAARGHGYALAVHGSLCRDIDLVAIPWVESATDCEVLAETLLGVLRGIFGRATNYRDAWADKPNGRRARSLYAFMETLGQHVQFDLSVMPLLPKQPEEAGEGA